MKPTVVILHPGAIGDVLLAVPVLRRLRLERPGHELVLLANGQVSRLLAGCAVVDEWLPMDGQAAGQLFGDTTEVSLPLRGWLERCALAVGWLQDTEGRLTQRLRQDGVKEVRVGSPFSSRFQALHQTDRLGEIAGLPSIDSSNEDPLIIPERWRDEGQRALARQGVDVGHPLVLVHPGSGSPHKCVGLDTLVPLVARFRQMRLAPILLEGPADRDAVTQLCNRLSAPPPVVRDLDLETVVGLMSHVHRFVGHDSGMTHLAGLFGIPTVALFGPTNPARWAPRGRHITVVQAEACRCPSWDEVRRCAEKPCLRHAVDEIVERMMATDTSATPGLSSIPALSLPTLCARVAS